MENKSMREFIIKFNELSLSNQMYMLAVQQALTFAQSSATEDKNPTSKPTKTA